jgi:hypothetical protein
MEIAYPAEPTYWIVTVGLPIAGVTLPEQVTTFGPDWSLLLQTVDETEWLEACAELGIGGDPSWWPTPEP